MVWDTLLRRRVRTSRLLRVDDALAGSRRQQVELFSDSVIGQPVDSWERVAEEHIGCSASVMPLTSSSTSTTTTTTTTAIPTSTSVCACIVTPGPVTLERADSQIVKVFDTVGRGWPTTAHPVAETQSKTIRLPAAECDCAPYDRDTWDARDARDARDAMGSIVHTNLAQRMAGSSGTCSPSQTLATVPA